MFETPIVNKQTNKQTDFTDLEVVWVEDSHTYHLNSEQVTEKKLMTEADEQKQLIQYARSRPWGQFLFHIPNESIGGYGWMIRNRQMGMRKGVPDLMLPIPMHGYHGLFSEMKAGRGRLSNEQKNWINALETFGYKAAVCVGWEEARDELEEYMND